MRSKVSTRVKVSLGARDTKGRGGETTLKQLHIESGSESIEINDLRITGMSIGGMSIGGMRSGMNLMKIKNSDEYRLIHEEGMKVRGLSDSSALLRCSELRSLRPVFDRHIKLVRFAHINKRRLRRRKGLFDLLGEGSGKKRRKSEMEMEIKEVPKCLDTKQNF